MKRIGFLLLLLLVGAGCNSEKTPERDTGTAFDKGDIIEDIHGDVSNEGRLYQFYENTENGDTDAVRVVSYTVEGDPIYQDLSYDGTTIQSVEDSTEDQYGSGEVVTRQCESILILTSETETVYVLEGCNPESGADTILKIKG